MTLGGFWGENLGYEYPRTLRDILEILMNQTEIRLYLPFSDWFRTANGHCPFAVPNQSVYGKYNPISV